MLGLYSAEYPVIAGHPPCSVWSREDGIVPKIADAIHTSSRDVYNLPREKEKERESHEPRDRMSDVNGIIHIQ